ncbi:MAG TPA: hypothetical protein VGQ14_03900, partial [Candidatus Eisenbacteria bacterium]|nr:hypothetical protein [Candidatus Eisenbacteria bacterium]
MIVYGDTSRREPIDGTVEVLRWRIDQALSADPHPAALRLLVERAGELEQALFDAPECLGACCSSRTRALAGVRRAGSWIASAFEHSYNRSPDPSHQALRRARDSLLSLTGVQGSASVTVPKGFAFYALFPESYRLAARRWAADHVDAARRDVLVVGIRSIGTTLSAVVAQAIREQRFAVRRRTVRLEGEPFERRLDEQLPKAAFGIVVDEGPGLSGSSMLAVADAMSRAGVGEVSLIHAHDRGPGPKVTESARRRWSSLRRYAAAHAELSFDGRTLAEELWMGVAPAIEGTLQRSDDVSAGAWRRFVYEIGAVWPDVSRPLERPKILCSSTDGNRVLFKFAGFAASPRDDGSLATAVARRAVPLAAMGFAPRLLGEAHGFVAWEWIEGRPLGIQDATPSLAARMGEYVARAAGPPLEPEDAREAMERARTMLLANTRECLGEDASSAAATEGDRLGAPAGTRTAGDGHLAPHEWVR